MALVRLHQHQSLPDIHFQIRIIF